MDDAHPAHRETPATVPVVEEQLRLDRQLRETGAVRVRIEVEEQGEPVPMETVISDVVVERVPIGRIVDRPGDPWQDGDVTVVPVYAEVPVVRTQLVLLEELRLHRRTRRVDSTQHVPLARQRAVVERRQGDGRWTEIDPPSRPQAMPRADPPADDVHPWSSKMRQTVIGVFDRHAAARQAAQQLRESGFGDSVYLTDEVEGEGSSTAAPAQRDEGGILAGVRHFFADLFGSEEDREVSPYAEAVRRGGAVVKVEVDEEERAEAAREALEAAGAVDIDERVEEWKASGWMEGTSLDLGRSGEVESGTTTMAGTAADTAMPPDARSSAATTSLPGTAAGERAATGATSDTSRAGTELRGDEVLPVVREELKVGKRLVRTGGVRVYARTVETPVQQSLELRSEVAQVERRPVDRPASEADLQALGSRTIEVAETAEEPVVAKEARVVEEVRVGKTVESRTEQVRDTVRRTDVQVEDLAGTTGSSASSGLTGDRSSAWRTHFDSNFSSSGGRWEDYEPAYRWGDQMRSDARFSGRSWDDSESDLRSEWERSGQAGPWERFKASVRHAWDRATS